MTIIVAFSSLRHVLKASGAKAKPKSAPKAEAAGKGKAKAKAKALATPLKRPSGQVETPKAVDSQRKKTKK